MREFLQTIFIGAVLLASMVACTDLDTKVFPTELRKKNYPPDLDTDSDGLTDLQELEHGFDPDDADSDNNGVSDRDDDPDGDGLTNFWEIALGFNPRDADSANKKYVDPNLNDNGVGDCDEDLDGDGATICWEIKYKFDNESAEDKTKDFDEDGFANSEEYSEFDPTDAENYPGSQPSLVLYDDDLDVKSRSNSQTVRGTFGYCFEGDRVLLTSSATQPAADDAQFVDCSTVEKALTGTLGGATEGEHTMYVWRQNTVGVVESPVKATVIYDVTGPAGDLSVSAQGYTSIDLTHTLPTATDYASVTLRRHKATSCSDKTATDGTAVSLDKSATSVSDTGLDVETKYCYMIYWYDDLGNFTSKEVQTETVSQPTCSITSQQGWYPGASVVYSFDCDQTVTSATDSGGTWPSYLSLATTLPVADGKFEISGTAGATHAATVWTVLVNGVNTFNVTTEVIGTTPSYTAATAADIGTANLSDNTDATFSVSAGLDSDYDGTDVTLKALMGDAASPDTTSNGSVATTESDIPLIRYTDASGCNDVADPTPWICPQSSSYAAPTASSDFLLHWNYDTFDQGQYFVRTKGYLDIDGADVYTANQDSRVVVANPGETATLNVNLVLDDDTAIGQTNYYNVNTWQRYVPAIAFNDTLSTSNARQVFGAVFMARVGNDAQFAGIGVIDRSTDQTQMTRSWFDPSAGASRMTTIGVDSQTMSITGTSGNTWLAFGAENSASGGMDLIANIIDYNGGAPATTTLDLSTVADTSIFRHVAVTNAFDDGGTSRHGLAFYSSWDPGGTNSQRVYVTKVNSEPATNDEAGLFNLGAETYYDGGSDLAGVVSSVEVTGDLNVEQTHIKIAQRDEGSTGYFYIGYIDSGAGTLQFARVVSDSGAVPTPVLTAGGHTIGNMFDFLDERGRPHYSIAPGEDEAGNDILGVLYSEDTSQTGICTFRVYRENAGNLEQVGNALSVSTNATCWWPHLFWNSASSQFMATYVDGSANANEDETIYTQFTVNAAGDTLSTRVEVPVTNRSASPCQMTASYSATQQRIAYMSVEGTCPGGNNDPHDMLFDIYKTPSK